MASIRTACVTALATALCAMFLAGSAIADDGASAPARTGPLGGGYEGQVYNGDGRDSVLTVFSRGADGTWTGSYVLGAEEDIETGTLDGCGWETSLLLVCRWNDRYGTGFARLLFSSDFRAFRGFWGNTMDALILPWDGARE